MNSALLSARLLLLALPAMAATIGLTLTKLVQNPFTGYWKLGWEGTITTSDPDHAPGSNVGLYRSGVGSGGPWTLVDQAGWSGSGPWAYGPKDSGLFYPLNTYDFKSGVDIRNKKTMAYVTTVYSTTVTFN